MPPEPAESDPYPAGALPIGTRLGEFEVRRVLGVGGFGIVYLAFDHQLEREVAVKEYMPASLAGRTETMHVSLLSQSHADTFALGLRSFINEARLLARFDHPSLVKVYRFWEENSTAYMTMPLYHGRTVKAVRLGMAGQPDEARVRTVLEPLLGAIERLHQEDVYHRDIAPDNILIEPDGHPVLLDFGAARRVITDKSQNLTAILKPSYAPIEQYGEAGSVKQGPWTDLYALGATMHFLLLGRPPMPAPARAVDDESPPLASLGLSGCSQTFLQLIDWMLAPRPAERPQSVSAVRKVLAGEFVPPAPSFPVTQVLEGWDRTRPMGTGAAQSTSAMPPTHGPANEKTIVEPMRASVRAVPVTSPPPADAVTVPMPTPQPPPVAAPARHWIPFLAAAIAVVAAGGAWFALKPAGPSPQSARIDAPPPASGAATEVKSPPLTASAASPLPAPVQAAAAAAPQIPSPAVPVTPRSIPANTQAAASRSQPIPSPQRAPAAALVAPATAGAKVAPRQGDASAKPVEPSVPAVMPSTAAAEQTAPPRAAQAAPADTGKATPDVEAAQSPSESCRKQISVLKWVCMDVQCGKSRFQNHPECLKLRADQERARAGGNR